MMTDNEIIKALECLHKRILQSKCAEEITETEIMGLVNALNLINRQKAKNESLKVDLAKCSIRLDNLYKTADEIKSEAIKEFAERLKTETFLAKAVESVEHVIWMNEIDNLVKEMTEEKNDFKE